jgi:hypothetical protein
MSVVDDDVDDNRLLAIKLDDKHSVGLFETVG